MSVAALIGPGERKSSEPMAARMAPDRDDRRHPFIPDGICDLEPIDKELAQANRLIGGFDAYLVIDETSLPKQGQHSVGVAPHRRPCSAREPTAAKPDKRSAPDGASWGPLSPAARAEPEIALEEIDRLTAAGVRFGAVLGRRSWAPFLGAVLAGAGYALSASFRQRLSARGLAWAVGVPRHQKVDPTGVSLIFPVAGRGRPRKNQIPGQLSVAAETVLGQGEES